MELKLRELRKNSNLTQEQVGKILNMTQSTYQTYENNRAVPTLENLIKLADYYNVSLDYLCNRHFKDEVGYLNEMQTQIVKILKQLNNENTIQAFGYLSGLLASQ